MKLVSICAGVARDLKVIKERSCALHASRNAYATARRWADGCVDGLVDSSSDFLIPC